jgi:hypothetical protein
MSGPIEQPDLPADPNGIRWRGPHRLLSASSILGLTSQEPPLMPSLHRDRDSVRYSSTASPIDQNSEIGGEPCALNT